MIYKHPLHCSIQSGRHRTPHSTATPPVTTETTPLATQTTPLATTMNNNTNPPNFLILSHNQPTNNNISMETASIATTPVTGTMLDISSLINSDQPLDLSTPTSRENLTFASSLPSEANTEELIPTELVGTEVGQAALDAVRSGTLTPLIKEELRLSIQHRRLTVGKEELSVSFEQPAPTKPSKEDELRRVRRKERNKIAAQKCRSKRREKAEALQEESIQLETLNKKLKDEISQLEEERALLVMMMTSHDTTVPTRCPTKMSVSSEEGEGLDLLNDVMDETSEETLNLEDEFM